MKILIDKNILLRMAQPAHPLFGEATNAVRLLLTQGHELVRHPSTDWGSPPRTPMQTLED